MVKTVENIAYTWFCREFLAGKELPVNVDMDAVHIVKAGMQRYKLIIADSEVTACLFQKIIEHDGI